MSELWHARKRIVLAVLVICSIYAVYILQGRTSVQKRHVVTESSASGSKSKTQTFSHDADYKSANKSGNLIVHISPPVKGKHKSRTVDELQNKEGNLSSDMDIFDVFRTKHHDHHKHDKGRKISESSSSWSSVDEADESSDSSSVDEDNMKVEDENVLENFPLEPHDAKLSTKRRGHVGKLGRKSKPDQKMSKKLPQALIIGVKKAGTRALLEFIRLHPDVKASGAEVHFFDKFYENGLDWYREQMPETLDGQLTMEKSPGYFPHPDVPKRVYKMNKDIKLVVIFREPVSRLISDYAQSLSKGKNKPYLEDQVFENYRKGKIDSNWSPILIGRYADHLERWLTYFPLKQFLFLNGDNFSKDPAKGLIQMQEFLGLDVVIDDNYFYFNKTKGFPCIKKGEKKKEPKCLGESKGRAHPEVDPYVIKALQSFYKPYNERLYEMTGIDFDWESHTPAKL